MNQGDLFTDVAAPARTKKRGFVQFREPSEASLMVGAFPLRRYLEQIDAKVPLMLFDFLKDLDWSEFEAAYTGYGRQPYSPRLMVGIILFGILENQFTLRGLERLAERDLGCMWVAAGIRPDHSSIGKFILLHETRLTSIFEQLTSKVLQLTGTSARECAVDGTMVQAAASRYRTVTREALDKKLENARRQTADDDAAKHLERYGAADKTLSEREAARRAQGKPTSTLRVSTTEPEAPVQPLKNKSFAPAYKPSVIANEKRIVTAIAVDPSSESAVVEEMLEQSKRVSGDEVEELSGDTGYCNETVINAALARDISLLAPETSNNAAPGAFTKQSFEYDESQDVYICPAKKPMTPQAKSADGYIRYKVTGCDVCELRGQCFKGKKTKFRTVKRYAVDDAKDALRVVMQDPKAQARYRQRKAIVEPVFAYMCNCLGLRRFRRKGLAKVRIEFALYAAANNFSRLYALLGRSGATAGSSFRRFFAAMRRWWCWWRDFRPARSIFGIPAGASLG